MPWNKIWLFQLTGFYGEYLLFAGVPYLVLYVLLPKFLVHRKINKALPGSAEVWREVLFSLQSLAIFAMTAMLVFVMAKTGWSRFYFRIDTYGWTYFWVSVVLFILIHDTWFYWTHRLLHWGPLYRMAHRIHHRSRHPTPLASFAFHPVEALIQAAIYPLVILFLPLHPWAGMIWLAYMGIMNVYLHLGFEFMPAGFARHWLLRWHNTAVHHDMHHNDAHSNYGLYFNIWDRLMDTNHKDYKATFEKVASGRTAGKVKRREAGVAGRPVRPRTRAS